VRPLEGTIEREHEDRLMEIIQRYDGRAFPTSLGLAGQWAKGRVRRKPQQSLEAIYCAELVATDLPGHGLLRASARPAGMTRGASGAATSSSSWPPFALGGEIAVVRPGRPRETPEPAPGTSAGAASGDAPSGLRLRLPGRRRRSPPQ
jgi:hypothetical protein